MPNRVLREGILTSERVNALDWPAEVFYRRLMSVVDDFGRYWAKPELLRAGLYPLHLDKVGNSDVGKWLTACVRAALVRTYTVAGKSYLVLLDFRQHARAEKSKFPEPPADAMQLQCECSADESQPLASVPVVEGVVGGEGGSARKRATPPPDSFEVTEVMAQWAKAQGLPAEQVIPQTERFLDHYRGQGKAMKDWDAAWRNWIRKGVEFRK